MAAAATTHHEPRMIALAELRESPTNPRRTWGDLEELAASIRKIGLLQPLLVRWVASAETRDKLVNAYELVFGHRRLRAAKIAGLLEVPCMVRELNAREALEAQVVENAQRTDLHELEEAEGYEQLHTKHGMSVEEIAAKVGKSRATVYGRMKLLALCPEARKAFYAGHLTSSTALYVARIPDAKLQLEAIKELAPRDEDDDPATAREAQQIIHSRFMLKLADAPWKVDDAELLVKAGPCTTCPKRTGNQRELFPDVKSPDVCTDPRCFREKLDAVWERRLASAKADGVQVVSPTAAKKLFHGSGHLVYDGGFVDLDATAYGVGNGTKTYRSLMKGTKAQVTIARDPDGRIHELVAKSAAAAVERKARKEQPTPSQKEQKKWDEQRKKDTAKRALETRVQDLALAEVTRKVEKSWKTDAKYLRHVIRLQITSSAIIHYDHLEKVAARRGLELGDRATSGIEVDDLVLEQLDKMAEPALRAFLFDLAVGELYGKELDELLALFKVDLPKLRKQAAADAKAPAKLSPKTSQKKGAKAGKDKGSVSPKTSQAGTCSVCGCTEDAACETDEGPCSWANAEQTLCSACAP